jgi:geranylgeranyl pyrophosphate synthase
MREGDRERVERSLGALADEARALIPGRTGEAVAYALLGEGKRVRGLLVLAAYRACGGRGDATGLALAVEVVHAYSLVHDDLPCMDDDDVRRGRPTVHRAFDVATATRVGVAMIPLAARVAWRSAQSLGLDPGSAGAIVARLMAASGAAGMVGGQLLDLDAEGRHVGLEELQEIHRGKTGSLITCAAVLGAGPGGVRRPDRTGVPDCR